jgi:hypothetical protein
MIVVFLLCIPFPLFAQSGPTRHFAPNNNFDATGHFAPAASGFDLADVSEPAQLNQLPEGVLALVWVGQCNGVDERFTGLVATFSRSSNVFGFYLMDDPSRTWGNRYCSPDSLRAEADWIHAVAPRVKSFIALMNIGSSQQPSFDGSYRPAVSHVDLFAISPYPCRSERHGCDFEMLDRYVAAADAAGFPRTSLVPGYQMFGRGRWQDDAGGRYELPTAEQARNLLVHWGRLLPQPVFDYAYSWGVQLGDDALESAPDLRAVMSAHNLQGK